MDSWLQEQNRLRQRRNQKNLEITKGAPFVGYITGAHDPDNEVVNVTYPGGERKINTMHPYAGTDSWIRVGIESGLSVLMAQRPDSNEPQLVSYLPRSAADRVRVFKEGGTGLYRPLTSGEIEIHSKGAAQTYYSRRPLLEHRAGLIRAWLNQDDLESGAKAPVHARILHLHKSEELGDEERFGVVQRPDGPINKVFIKADRAPDPGLVADFAIEAATAGVIAEPGPWAKEYTRIIKTGALFPPILVDHREGDVMDDEGNAINLSSSGSPLRYKAEYFCDSILGGEFFVGIDKDGNFSIALPDEASTGGDITIPAGDLILTIGKSYTVSVQTDYSLSTLDGGMTLDSKTDYQLTVQDGSAIFKPSKQFDIGGADEPAVLGNVFVEFAGKLIDILVAHFHTGNMGAPTPLDPGSLAQLNQLKASPIQDKMVLSDYINFSKAP